MWVRIQFGKGLWDQELWKLLLLSLVSYVQKQLWCLHNTGIVVCNFMCFVHVISQLHLNIMDTYILDGQEDDLPLNCIILIYRKYTLVYMFHNQSYSPMRTVRQLKACFVPQTNTRNQQCSPQCNTSYTQLAHFHLKVSSNQTECFCIRL